MDVLQLLKTDHAEVTKLFQRFRSGGRGQKSVAEKICKELEVHAEVEEEFFYPAVRETGDQELQQQVDEAVSEHRRVKEQVSAIQQTLQDGGAEHESGRLDGMIQTLQQDVEHHVTEEEGVMFPRVQEVMDDRRRSELGRRVRDRKQELMGGEGSLRTRRRSTTARTPSRTRAAGAKPRRGRGKTTASSTKSGTKSRAKRARGGRGR